jgi:2-succinyl-5-enolpyruvyl-6-hydroxy-3-cyclohexene-1-carboxylate synthase
MADVNPSTLLARLTVEALRVGGIRHVVLCPGSRSAPLAYALGASDAVDLRVRHDERVAAFTAMGAAGAVVTTSGTAAANLHPAVLEAHHGRRPLVVVTADRPKDLRGTWANQTTELQPELYGRAVRARLDLADVDAAKDPEATLQALVEVVTAARERRGAVHLDLGFSEPLLPDDEAGQLPLAPRHRTTQLFTAPGVVEPGPRTVVVAGDGAGDGAGSALGARAREVALAAGWPLLAEPSSGAAGPDAVAAYRLLVELPELGGRVERAVVHGRPTLSRPVMRLLARPEVELVLVTTERDWPDPGRPHTRVAPLDVATLPPASGDRGWAQEWALASLAARASLDAVLDEFLAEHPDLPRGPLVARTVALASRPGDTLVVAASNPVRDLDLVAHRLPRGVRVLANRGLAGIDGTLSTAAGAALGGGFVRVLVGDLAFLHDANALLVPPGEERPHLQIVVLNDDGGGIFSLLEQGELATHGPQEAADFERLFGTPHGVDLAAVCSAYRVPHQRVDDVPALVEALESPAPGTSVVEVRTTRNGLRDVHGRIRAAVHAAVRGALRQT